MALEIEAIREAFRGELRKTKSRIPKIINKTMETANKEYEIGIPPLTKRFTMHMRETDKEFRLAFEKGRVATPKEPYFTVKTNGDYWEDDLELNEIFYLYVACASAGKTIEVVAWR